jgi:excisionase family DNA binding protein
VGRLAALAFKPYPSYDRAMERHYLRTRQVAQLLGVSLNTVYRWLKKERISEPLRGAENNYRLWTAEDIERIRQELIAERP